MKILNSGTTIPVISNASRGIAFNEKQELARSFVKCYLGARQGLAKLGILRSERTLQGDYAEWLVAELLELKLTSSKVQKGFDATDTQGRTYQIKSRIVRSLGQNTSFDFANIEEPFDYLVCVFFSPTFELLGIARLAYTVVYELGTQNVNGFRFRWNKRTSTDGHVEKLAWPEEV
jgi:hypothetical protein